MNIAQRIVKLSEDVSELKAAQIACGAQYRMYPQELIYEFTTNYISQYSTTTYQARYEFSNDSPFVLFGVSSAMVYKNGSQLAWSTPQWLYGANYDRTVDGLLVSLSWNIYADDANDMRTRLDIVVEVPSTYSTTDTVKVDVKAYTSQPGFYKETLRSSYNP